MTEDNLLQKKYDEFEEEEEAEDKLNTALAILSFIFPLIGIIIYLSNKKTRPKAAGSASFAALLGLLSWSLIQALIK